MEKRGLTCAHCLTAEKWHLVHPWNYFLLLSSCLPVHWEIGEGSEEEIRYIGKDATTAFQICRKFLGKPITVKELTQYRITQVNCHYINHSLCQYRKCNCKQIILLLCTTSAVQKSLYIDPINSLWNTKILAYLRNHNICLRAWYRNGFEVWECVVLGVLEINQELLQAIRFQDENVTRGFPLAGGRGRLDSSLLERSIYQKNFNDLTGHQNKTEREKKKKKKASIFAVPLTGL